jgi:methionyl-tRNA synthetase
MPSSAREILRRVGAATEGVSFDRDGAWRNDGERVLVQEGPLWPRKESTTVSDHQTQPPAAPAPAATPDVPAPAVQAPAAPANAAAPAAAPGERIAIDDFMKVELRTAKVLAAERVPKSKKLLKLQVDAGIEHRTLVAGIAEAYEPEALVGKTVVIVFNLKPATLMGIESNGMVLAASPEGGKPTVITFDDSVPPGSRVR